LAFNGRTDDYIVSICARYCALNQKEILFGNDLNDAKILDGPGIGAHVARHRLILPNAAGSLAHTDRADSTMEHGSMRCWSASDTEALYDTLKPLSLCNTTNIN
jgi:hypothetical protein